MEEILSRVRKTLGEDALILATRKHRRKPLGAFTETVYEVSAAVDRHPAPPSPPSAPPPAPPPAASPAPQAPFEAYLSLEKELAPLREEIATMKSFLSLMAEEKRTPPSPGRNGELDRLISEVRSLHDMMESSAAPAPNPSPAEEPAAAPTPVPSPAIEAAEPPAPVPCSAEESAITLAPEPPSEDDWLVRRLLEQGVEHGACGRIRTAVTGRLDPTLRPAAEEIRREAGAVIESAVRATGVPPPGNRGPRILVFVGPTGAGKTVAAARAGRLLSRRGFRCAAVSAGDDPPAHTLLASSLERDLGIPTLSARDDEELSRVVARCSGAQYLLVDVSGRTCGDRQALRKLARAIGRRAEIDFCLTLPAGWGGTRAERIVEKLKPLPVGFLTFTKLDETDRYGEMYNAAAAAGVPVLFLTAGRSLPGRILTAHPRMFSRLLLDKFPPTENVP